MARRGGRRGKGRRGRGARGGRGGGRGGRGAAASAAAPAPDTNNATTPGIPPASSVGYLHKKFKRLAEVGNEDDSGSAGTAAGEQGKSATGASGENSDPTFGPTFNGSPNALAGPGGPLRLRRQSSGPAARAEPLARGETPVVKHCDRCGLRFKTKASLQKHRLMTHHIRDDGIEIPAFLRRPPVTTTSTTTTMSSSSVSSAPSTSSAAVAASTSGASSSISSSTSNDTGGERKIYKPKFRMKALEDFEETAEEPARPPPASSTESLSASSSLLMPVPAAPAEPPPTAPSPFLASAALINPMMSVLNHKDDTDSASAMELSAAVATAIATVDADMDTPFDLSAKPSNGRRDSFGYLPSGGLQDQNVRQDGDKNDGPISLVTQNHYGKPLSLQQPSPVLGRPPSPQHSPLNLRQVHARDQPPPPSHNQPPFQYPGDAGARRHLQQHNYQDRGAAHQSLPPHGMPVPMTHQVRPSYQPQAQTPHDLSQSSSMQRHGPVHGGVPPPVVSSGSSAVRSGFPRALESDKGAHQKQLGSIVSGTPRQRYQQPPPASPAQSAGPPPPGGTKKPLSNTQASAPLPAQPPLLVQHVPYGMPPPGALMPPGFPGIPMNLVPYPHLPHGAPAYLMPKSYLPPPGPVLTPPPTTGSRSTPPASSMTVTATAQWKPSLKIDIPKSSNSTPTSSSSSSASLNSPSAAAVAAAAKGLRSPEAITQHITKIISQNEAIVETLNPLWSSKRYLRQEAAAKAAAAAAAASSSVSSNHSTTITGSGVMMASSTSIASVPPAPSVAQPTQSPGGKFSVSKILSFDKGSSGGTSIARSNKIVAPPPASSNSHGAPHHPQQTMAPMPSHFTSNSTDNGVHGKKTCGKCNAIFYNTDSHLVHTRTCVGPLTLGFGGPPAGNGSAPGRSTPSPAAQPPSTASNARKSPGNVNGGGAGGLATTSRVPEVQPLQATDLSRKTVQQPVQPPPPQNLVHRAYLPPQQPTSTFQQSPQPTSTFRQSPQPQPTSTSTFRQSPQPQQMSPPGGIRPSANKMMPSSAVNATNVPPAKKRKVEGPEPPKPPTPQPAIMTPVPSPLGPASSPGPGMHMFGSQVRINEGSESKTVVHIGTKMASSTPVPPPATTSTPASSSSGQASPVVVTMAKSGLHSGGTTIIQQTAVSSSPSIPHSVFDQAKTGQSMLGSLSPAGASPAAAVVAAGASGSSVEGALYRLEPNVNAKFPYFLGPQLLKLPSGPSVFDNPPIFSASSQKSEKPGSSEPAAKPCETQPPPAPTSNVPTPAIEAISPPSSPSPSPADTPTAASPPQSVVTPIASTSEVSAHQNGSNAVPNSKKRALDFNIGPSGDRVCEDSGNKKMRRPNTLPLPSVASSDSASLSVTPSMSRDKQRCMSSLMSPETPRPRRSYGQLYLNGHAYTYLGLRSKTQVVYCCVFNPQPTYVPLAASEEPNLSMYSNWQVRKSSEADGLGLTPPETMGLYDSNRNKNVRKDGAAYVVAAGSASTVPTSTVSSTSVAASTLCSAVSSSPENLRPLLVGFDSLSGSGYSPTTYTVAEERRDVSRTSESGTPSSSAPAKTEAAGSASRPAESAAKNTRRSAITVLTPSSYWTEKSKNESKVKVEEKNSDCVRVKEEHVDQKTEIATAFTDKLPATVKAEPMSPKEECADKKQDVRMDVEHVNKRKNKTPRKLSIDDGSSSFDEKVASAGLREDVPKSSLQPGCEDGSATSVAVSGPAPKRIKIFEGGFKSLDDYEYVRGRGRGRYVCGECGIRCKKPSMLKKHLRIHTNLRPYTCKYCNFSFKTKGNLTKHAKSKAHLKKKEQVLAARNNNNDNGNGAGNVNSSGKAFVASSSSSINHAAGDGSKLKDPFSSAEDDSCDEDHGDELEDGDEDLDDEEEEGAEDDEDEDDDTDDDGSEGDETDEEFEENGQSKYPQLPPSLHSVGVSAAKRDAVQGLLCLSSTRVAPTSVPAASSAADVAPRDGVLPSLASVVTTLSAQKEHEWLSVNSSQFLARMTSPATDVKPSDASLMSPKSTPVVPPVSTVASSVVVSTANTVIATTSASGPPTIVNPPMTSAAAPPPPSPSPSPPRLQPTPPDTVASKSSPPPQMTPSNASGTISTDEETEEDEEPVFETDEDKDGGLPIHQGIITVPTGVFPPPSSLAASNAAAFFSSGSGAGKLGAAAAGSAVPTFGRVNGDDERSVCGICGKAFSKPSQLKIHVNIHYFERPHRCDACAVSFRTRGHLQKHKKSVSHFNKLNMNLAFGAPTSDNPRPFKCNDCDKPFRIHGHLAKHLRSKLHIMKLECLGKLPFGTYAEMERAGISLNDIDTSDCDNSLDSLIKVAAKLNLSSSTSAPSMPSAPMPPTPSNNSPPRSSPQFQNHNSAPMFDGAFKGQDPVKRSFGGPMAPPASMVAKPNAPSVGAAPSPVDFRQFVSVKYEDISDSD